MIVGLLQFLFWFPKASYPIGNRILIGFVASGYSNSLHIIYTGIM